MATYENGILGLVPQAEWLNVGFNVTRQNDPIDSLFGDEKTDNISARWQSIASEYQIPVMAQFHAFDAKTLTTYRPPVDNHYIEKGLIKVQINQSERMRALIRTGVREDALYDYVIGDGVRCAEQVFTRSKVAKNELLSTGKLTIKENNLDLTVDYGVPSAQTEFEIDLDTAADLDAQLDEIVQAAKDVGVTLNGIVTSSQNIRKMRANAGLQKNINGNVGVGSLVRSSALREYLAEEYGITNVIVNDTTYNAENGIDENGRPLVSMKRYFPVDKITFIGTNPGGRVGTGLWGNPPTIDSLKFGHTQEGNGGVSPYVVVDQYCTDDPVVIWTRAAGLFIPVLYSPNSLFIVTVKADENTPSVKIDKSTATVAAGSTTTLTATTVPADANVTWTSSDETAATVSNGTVTGVAAGTATITATITVDGTDYTDTCSVTVSGV